MTPRWACHASPNWLEGGSTESDWVARARVAVEADLERSAKEVGPDHLRIVELMRAALPEDAVVVRDTTVPGYLWGNRLLPILRPRTSIRPSSSAIGPGIGLAIGAALGTGATTVLIVGDGGFQLGLGESPHPPSPVNAKDWTWVLERPCPECGLRRARRRP